MRVGSILVTIEAFVGVFKMNQEKLYLVDLT